MPSAFSPSVLALANGVNGVSVLETVVKVVMVPAAAEGKVSVWAKRSEIANENGNV